MTTDSESEAQSSFGIRKIVDCKLDKNGKEIYKVKWEPTWEPAENLASCQHLIDRFWKFVNTAKTNQSFVPPNRKRLFSDSSSNGSIPTNDNLVQHKLTEGSKAEIQQLILRTNATSTGNVSSLSIPIKSENKNIQQTNMMAQIPMQNKVSSSPFNNIQQNQVLMPLSSPSQKGNSFSHSNSVTPTKVMKTDGDDSKSKDTHTKQSSPALSTSSLKYLENFNNPYVKVIVACKICGKEQPFKLPGSWKQHFFTHSDQKPHPCTLCSKSFMRPVLLRQHMEKCHSVGNQKAPIKMEAF